MSFEQKRLVAEAKQAIKAGRMGEAQQLCERALKKEIRRQTKARIERPVGKSRSFLDVLKLAETVAPTD